MSSVINRARVKRAALEIAKETRTHQWTRVSSKFTNRIELATLSAIRFEVRNHPSKGKTLL